ncbi:MAG: hypothetical protein N2039_12805 [Gemmataceae bacterium]|nr:hypothetical protein [Gemmataceae bacterium]
MVRRSWWAVIGVVAVATVSSTAASERESVPQVYSFGTLRTAAPEVAREQALNWLQQAGLLNAETQPRFDAIWSDANRPLLDKVAATLALHPAAEQLLREVSDLGRSVPKEVPALIKDKKQPAFFRANLALVFAKQISSRRVYEEALEALKSVQPEDVVDPAAYLFHKAVAEHALIRKDDASRTILRLLDDVADAPERYKMVASLMLLDLQTWRNDEKDLLQISKLMDNSGRRLDLARGGPKTQEIQKKIVFRLDEVIKELENQCNGNCSGNGGNCPGGKPGNGGGANPTSPMQDSNIATNGGPGRVDEKKLKELAEVWGKLPEKERAKAMMELTKDLPPRYREIIENYAKSLARGQK